MKTKTNIINVHAIWAEQDVEKKKQMILDFVYNFAHTKTPRGKIKQREFIRDIHKPSYNKSRDLDRMASELKLSPEGLGVWNRC